MPEESKTLEKIHQYAAEEFLEKGFMGASLRNIVQRAGVTTGAFYGYYKSKEELFDALVGEPADYMLNMFGKVITEFANLPKEEQPSHMGETGNQYMFDMLDYAYDYKDAFRLILGAAAGTKYEDYVHRTVEMEIEATHRFMDVLEELGQSVKRMDPYFEHMLVSGMFSSFFEIIIHDIPKERAIKCIEELHDFYTAGWSKTIGI
ncbi:AcrR family transcriptional regulator [Aequitasia blattaphilus]|uniref:TetR/AcrR family transcriptional regulator n=1 Tax=Aequitasia blattaphilus TaxID=2949332 RepID=A0ABT1E7D7_9FIRM|nr:TetR/AcrR family transcriptional regulator [Aequitasia blattaphilus]MCP1101729.1 TetR/AcrR family transcriptional regulator [Aequitasia blattaphilus]MCR8614369.1 TetR/AcrR family transcriptional regulator [Aequitasia blattaphilus]